MMEDRERLKDIHMTTVLPEGVCVRVQMVVLVCVHLYMHNICLIQVIILNCVLFFLQMYLK